jgi:tetratricopeptide (TPR) repeat protein
VSDDTPIGLTFQPGIYDRAMDAIPEDREEPIAEIGGGEVLRIGEGSQDNSAESSLNDRAWALVDPDRPNRETDVELGLQLARQALDLASEQCDSRDTLAWALFANGLEEEALKESEKALELAPDEQKCSPRASSSTCET